MISKYASNPKFKTNEKYYLQKLTEEEKSNSSIFCPFNNLYQGYGSLCIQYLPKELQNTDSIKSLIEDDLCIGKTHSINIRTMTLKNNSNIYWAYIYFYLWHENKIPFFNKLIEDSEVSVNGYTFESNNIDFNYENDGYPFKYLRFALHTELPLIYNESNIIDIEDNEKNCIFIKFVPFDLCLDGAYLQTESQLTHFFENKLNIGIIERIDIIFNESNGVIKRSVYVHFKKWFNYPRSIYYRKYIFNEQNKPTTINSYTNIDGSVHYMYNKNYILETKYLTLIGYKTKIELKK